MFWNVNGLRARWNSQVLPFRQVVEVKKPDVCVLLEVRADTKKVLKLRGFEEWLEEQGSHFNYFIWTGESGGNRVGEAGVALLSKVRPVEVFLGLGDLGVAGRVVVAE